MPLNRMVSLGTKTVQNVVNLLIKERRLCTLSVVRVDLQVQKVPVIRGLVAMSALHLEKIMLTLDVKDA